MAALDWEWPILSSHQHHSDRHALLRRIRYEMTAPRERGQIVQREGSALTLNISSGGMLVLMKDPPRVEQVVKVSVPTPVDLAETPTLAEVRWTRTIPIAESDGLSFVGLRFLF